MVIYRAKFDCITEKDTETLAKKFANIAKKGDIFALFGTLGVGKSTFSRFFIQELTGAKDVPSPTFNLVQIYEADEFDIYHYDMYRIKSPVEAYELDIEDAFYNGISLIEWPEKIVPLLPKDIWKITISVRGSERVFEIETESAENFQRLKEIYVD